MALKEEAALLICNVYTFRQQLFTPLDLLPESMVMGDEVDGQFPS